MKAARRRGACRRTWRINTLGSRDQNGDGNDPETGGAALYVVPGLDMEGGVRGQQKWQR